MHEQNILDMKYVHAILCHIGINVLYGIHVYDTLVHTDAFILM